jgi:hypothetical protein
MASDSDRKPVTNGEEPRRIADALLLIDLMQSALGASSHRATSAAVEIFSMLKDDPDLDGLMLTIAAIACEAIDDLAKLNLESPEVRLQLLGAATALLEYHHPFSTH